MSTPKIAVDTTLDCKGLACPMPIVKTKKAMDALNPGQVIEVQATDRGSLADLQSWAAKTGQQYLGSLEQDGVLKHYVRKSNPGEIQEEKKYPYTAEPQELNERLGDSDMMVLDVREPAEYAFSHIPGAISIPLGELTERLTELNPEHEIYVICRTGSRSDFACQQLAENGFNRVKNVIPGMAEWIGQTETSH